MKKLLKLNTSDPVYIAKMKEIILKDFIKRVSDNVDGNFLLISTALDPRFKSLKMIDDNTGAREQVFCDLEDEIKAKAEMFELDEPVVKSKTRKNGSGLR